MKPGEAPFEIGMLVFDQMTQLDFAGPCDAFARVPCARTHIIGKESGLVTTDSGVRIMAEMALDDAPPLDMIFVPGGFGTTALMDDSAVLGFLTRQAVHAQWITSVCTGALVLGSAGLLAGYRATTHWSALDQLALLGAEATKARVVIDRDRVTGAGVTAGIDFGLTLIARLWGADQAKLIQLGQEYDPAPPFAAGSPDLVPDLAAHFKDLTADGAQARIAAAKRARTRLGI